MDSVHFKYTMRHKKAFLFVEKQLLGRNTIRGYLHDIDKLFLYLLAKPGNKWVSNLHRYCSRHHTLKARTRSDFVQMVIDWECARYTKPDKPLNARQTMKQIYPQMIEKVEPILKDLGL